MPGAGLGIGDRSVNEMDKRFQLSWSVHPRNGGRQTISIVSE